MQNEAIIRGLQDRTFRSVLVCTGAGVSTNAGIPDFRSPDGIFAMLRERYPGRTAEFILSKEGAAQFGVLEDEAW